MEDNEQKKMYNRSDTKNNKNIISKENIFTNFINYLFKEKPWAGSIAVFIITIIINAISANLGGNISFFKLLIITFLVTIILFVCLSPVLVMHLVKNLQHFIIDKETEEKNIKLFDIIRESANSLKLLTGKLDKLIERNKDYFDKSINHMDSCPGIDNLVRRSHMINNVDEYYQHLIKLRENTDEKDVYLTNFSTKPYVIDNKNRDEFYSTNNDFIKRAKCNVYRIVTVHSKEKLLFLKKLLEDAKESDSVKYHLAYLDIKRFSDETGDKLPGIVGMDIIENKIIIMDFKYARALRKNDGFEKPLYIESEEIADKCRMYYKAIWDDISNEVSASKRRYQGYILYNGTSRKVHEDIDNIWTKIENKIHT